MEAREWVSDMVTGISGHSSEPSSMLPGQVGEVKVTFWVLA